MFNMQEVFEFNIVDLKKKKKKTVLLLYYNVQLSIGTPWAGGTKL